MEYIDGEREGMPKILIKRDEELQKLAERQKQQRQTCWYELTAIFEANVQPPLQNLKRPRKYVKSKVVEQKQIEEKGDKLFDG